VVASQVVTGIFALAMIVAAGLAAVVLPAWARIPLHVGSVERCVEVPKRAGLGTGGALHAGARSHGVLLAFEVGALLARERETSARSE
jgi:hypothetical protein